MFLLYSDHILLGIYSSLKNAQTALDNSEEETGIIIKVGHIDQKASLYYKKGQEQYSAKYRSPTTTYVFLEQFTTDAGPTG